MRPEAADYLDKARSCLADAQQIATVPLPHIAAREAYLAAYNAAEAYVFEFTGRPAKTHRGLRAAFSRLAKDEPRIDQSSSAFLAKAYEFKSIADYSIDTASRAISAEDASSAIATAGRFIDTIAPLLSPGLTPLPRSGTQTWSSMARAAFEVKQSLKCCLLDAHDSPDFQTTPKVSAKHGVFREHGSEPLDQR